MNLINLLVKLGLDASEYTKGLGDAEGKADSASKKIVDGLSSIGGTVVTAGVAAAAAGMAALTAYTVGAVGAAMEAQQVEAQLAAVLQSTGGVAGVTAEQVTGLADAFSKTTMFEDDMIVSGENMLLTFTNIGKDVFPLATQTMLDMSQALGQGLKSSAMQLGKAINDPTEGISALTRVGVTFTEEQKKQIETMQKAGDIAGAQTIILNELQREFGGAAEAAGGTFAGKMTILQNRLGNVQETLGMALIPILMSLVDAVMPVVDGFAGFVEMIALAIEDAGAFDRMVRKLPEAFWPIGDAINYLLEILYSGDFSDITSMFQNAFSWLMDHKEIIIGIMGAIGVSIAMWVYTTVIPAFIAWITAMAPVVLPFLAIAAVIALLYKAWETNFMGIREIVADVVGRVVGFIQDLIQMVQTWYKQNKATIDAIIQTGWKVLQAVIQNFVALIVPAFWKFVAGVQSGFSQMGPLIEALKALWATLWPAIQIVLTIIGAALLGFVGLVVGVVTGIAQAIEPLITTFIGVATGIIQALEGVIDFFRGFVDVIVGLVTGNSEQVQDGFEMMKTGVVKIFNGLVNGVVSLVTGFVATIKAFISGLVSGVVNFFTNLYNQLIGHSIIPDMIADIISAIADFVSDFIDNIVELVEGVVDQAVTMASNFLGAVNGMIGDVLGALSGAVGAMWQVGADLFEGLWNGAAAMWEDFLDWAAGMAGNLPEWLQQMLGMNGGGGGSGNGGGGGSGGGPGGDGRGGPQEIGAMLPSGPMTAIIDREPVAQVVNNNYTMPVYTSQSPAVVQNSFNLVAAMGGAGS